MANRLLLTSFLVTVLGCHMASDPSPEKKEAAGRASSPISVSPAADAPSVTVDTNPVSVATRVAWNDGRAMAAFDGTNFVTAWSDSRTAANNIFLARVRETDGAILDPTGVLLSEHTPPILALGLFQNPPSRDRVMTATGGGNTYVSWREFTEGTGERMIVARIDASGKVVARHSIDGVATTFLDSNGGTGYTNAVAGLSADSSGAAAFYYARNPTGGFDVVARRIVGDSVSAPITLLSGLRQFSSDAHCAMSEGALIVDHWGEFPSAGGPRWESYYAAVPAGSTALPVVHETPMVGAQSWNVFGVGGQFRLIINTGDVNIAKIDGSGNVLALNAGPSNGGWSAIAPSTVADQFVVHEGNPSCLQTFDGDAKAVGACVPIDNDPEIPGSNFGQPSMVVGSSTVAAPYLLGGNAGDEFDPYRFKLGILNRTTGAAVASPNVALSANRQMFSDVATDGQTYVATWREDRVPPAQSGSLGAVYAARLDAEGKMVGTPILLSSGPSNLQGALGSNAPSPRVIFDGSKYIVAWGQGVGGGGSDSDRVLSIFAAILPSTGNLVVEKSITVPSSGGFGDVALSNDGKNTLLAFTRTSGFFFEISLARISNSTHDLIDTQPKTISTPGGVRFAPALAFNGTRTLAVWINQQANSLVVAGRFIDAGEVEPKNDIFPIYDSGRFALQPALASDKKNGFLMAWNELATENYDQNLYGKLIGDDGSLSVYDPMNGKRTATLEDAIPLSRLGHDQRNHRLVYSNDGTNYFVAWSDGRRAPDYDIRGTWIDTATGKVHDLDGFPISTQTGVYEASPAVVFPTASSAFMLYQEFSSDAQVGAMRLKARKISASSLLGVGCASNDDCASRSCVDGVCCNNACNNGCGTCSAVAGTCTPKPATTACGPSNSYLCSGSSLSCTLSCGPTTPCAPGSHCANGQCEPIEARCADETTAEPAPGELIPCAPFKCLGNACLTRCGSVDDCAAGLICDFAGKCLAPPGPPPPEEPTCSMGEGRASAPWFTLAMTLSAIGASRIRRSKQARRSAASEGGAE